MADALGMDVSNRSEQLVRVKLDEQVGHHLLHLQVLLHDAVGRVRNEIHHNVQVDLVLLVTIRVEGLAHLHTVGVVQHLQNLQLSVLVALILEHLLDGDCLACLRDRGLKDDAERAISNDFLSVVSEALL